MTSAADQSRTPAPITRREWHLALACTLAVAAATVGYSVGYVEGFKGGAESVRSEAIVNTDHMAYALWRTVTLDDVLDATYPLPPSQNVTVGHQTCAVIEAKTYCLDWDELFPPRTRLDK